MLRARVLTAIALLVPLAAAFHFLDAPGLYLVFCLVGLAAAWEWGALAGLDTPATRMSLVVAMAIALGLAWLAWRAGAAPWVLAAGVVWWAWAAWLMRDFPDSLRPPRWRRGHALLAGFLMIVPALVALAMLRAGPGGLGALMLVVLIVWGADIGAYFTGRAFGRRKLAPAISPGKSIEGALGGAVVAFALVFPLGLWLLPLSGLAVPLYALLVLLSIVVSVQGDLVESAFKRVAGVKDSGRLLPGHCGVLDRVDSLLSAAPVYALGVYLLAGGA